MLQLYSISSDLKASVNKTRRNILSNINYVKSKNNYTFDDRWFAAVVKKWEVPCYTAHLLASQIGRSENENMTQFPSFENEVRLGVVMTVMSFFIFNK